MIETSLFVSPGQYLRTKTRRERERGVGVLHSWQRPTAQCVRYSVCTVGTTAVRRCWDDDDAVRHGEGRKHAEFRGG